MFYIHFLFVKLNLTAVSSLYNSGVMPIEEGIPLCHFDGKLARLCVMGEVGGGKKAFIIARAQAEPPGEMESVIVVGVDCEPELWGVREEK